MNHLSDETLAAHLLGEEDATAHLLSCEKCRTRLDQLADAMLQAQTGEAAAPLSLSAEQRFWPFVQRLEALWQLSNDAVKTVLARATQADQWLDFFQGSRVFHLEGGPALAGKDVGLVEIPAGATFQMHSHNGPEHVLVLQGGFIDSATGRTLRAGDSDAQESGTPHELVALPGENCIYAVVNDGVEFIFS